MPSYLMTLTTDLSRGLKQVCSLSLRIVRPNISYFASVDGYCDRAVVSVFSTLCLFACNISRLSVQASHFSDLWPPFQGQQVFWEGAVFLLSSTPHQVQVTI